MSDGKVEFSESELTVENQKLRKELARLTDVTAEAERAKQEYMQNVAHQLAAPINAIKMNIEAIKNPRMRVSSALILQTNWYCTGSAQMPVAVAVELAPT